MDNDASRYQPARGISDTFNAIFARCEGAYSKNTLWGYRNDLKHFQAWCAMQIVDWLPAAPATIAAFVDEQVETKAISTIKRRISAIQFAHRIADLPSPIGHSEIYLALRRAGRAKRRRPQQALGLTSVLLNQIVDACPDTLMGLRDAAMFSIGYDTLCRRSELVAMRVEHLSDDLSSIVVPRSKSDPFGDGRMAYLSPGTVVCLKAWLSASKLRLGPLFQGLHTGRMSEASLDTSSIRRRIKVVARRAGLDAEVVLALSGHSMRIGAAQDMLVAGCHALGIMQAGGWRSYAVLSRYVEHASAAQIHRRRWDRISLNVVSVTEPSATSSRLS